MITSYINSHLMQVQREQIFEWSHLSTKLPLICIDSTPFVVKTVDQACTLEGFRNSHGLDVGVHNVFVESSRFPMTHLENAKILDVILKDQVSSIFSL